MNQSEATKCGVRAASCRKQGNRFAKHMFRQNGQSVSAGKGTSFPCREHKLTPAFTLIEVMVSVMIISVVIASLLQLFSNNTHLLGGMDKKVETAMRSTLLLGIGDHGFEKHGSTLDTLVEEFEIDDDLRRRLKTIRMELDYVETMRFGAEMTLRDDTAFADEVSAETDVNTPLLTIGKTSLQIGDQQTSLVRMTLQ